MARAESKHRRRRGVGGVLAVVIAAFVFAFSTACAQAAPGDPLFIFSPVPPPPPAAPEPPPNGYLNGPCGLAVDSAGRFWVSDYYHRGVAIFHSNASYDSQPLTASNQPNPHTRTYDDPCGSALDSTGTLYLNNYHRNVTRFPAPVSAGTGTVLAGSEEATGVAVSPANDHAYLDLRDHVGEYDSSGAPVRDIGAASLEDGYGIAVSGFPATAGNLYVPDAATNTVKVYDPTTDTEDPVDTITGPPGGFTSLVDSAVAVDNTGGDIYVTDDTEPAHTEEPRARIDVFNSTGAYEGHLKYDVIDPAPAGLAVDNSGSATQGRVYVTSGNTHRGAVYAYPPGAATTAAPLASKFHQPLFGSGLLFPTVPIGGPGGGAAECEGDACQILPPEPVDPTLTTLLSGRGNPKERYRQYHNAKVKPKQKRRHRKGKHARAASSARIGGASPMPVLDAPSPSPSSSPPSISPASPGAAQVPAAPATAQASTASAVLLPGTEGFSAEAFADGGASATQAGSHPYELDLSAGLDQGGGEQDLKSARLTLPPGLLLNPANGTGLLCSDAAFATPRSTPFAAGSESGRAAPTSPRSERSKSRRALTGERRAASASLISSPTQARQRASAPPPSECRWPSTC